MARSLIVPSTLALLATLGLALGGAACNSAESPAVANTAPAAIDVGRENIVTVQTAEITVGPLISGDLRAQLEATVRAELGGSVVQVVPDEGQAVKQGALLARIEARTQQDAAASRRSRCCARPRSRCQWPSASWRAPSGWSRAARWRSASSRRRATPPCSARAQRDDAQSRLASASKALADGDGPRADCGHRSRAACQPRRRRQPRRPSSTRSSTRRACAWKPLCRRTSSARSRSARP